MPGEYSHIEEYGEEILRLKAEGKTRAEIGAKLGFTKEQIHNFISRHNEKQRKIAVGIAIKKKGRPAKDMTMQTLTPIVLQELIDKIEVFPIEGTGKNRTQRLVIHYRFVGCIDLPSIVPKHTYKLDSRQGVAIEYLPSAV